MKVVVGQQVIFWAYTEVEVDAKTFAGATTEVENDPDAYLPNLEDIVFMDCQGGLSLENRSSYISDPWGEYDAGLDIVEG